MSIKEIVLHIILVFSVVSGVFAFIRFLEQNWIQAFIALFFFFIAGYPFMKQPKIDPHSKVDELGVFMLLAHILFRHFISYVVLIFCIVFSFVMLGQAYFTPKWGWTLFGFTVTETAILYGFMGILLLIPPFLIGRDWMKYHAIAKKHMPKEEKHRK